jgi:hypothetical protein
VLFPQSYSKFRFTFDNFGADPGATPGAAVTPGTSNAEGSWLSPAVATSAQLTQDVYGIYVRVSDGGTSLNIKNHLLDIGVDPAGGTSYVAVISNIVCGASAQITATGSGHAFFFPFYIKAGSSVSVRIQGGNATAGTVRVAMKFYGQPSNPESVLVGSFSETIGTITGSDGVTFTPGNAADGTWVDLGTTVKAMWWWQLCYQISNTVITAEYTYIDLAYGDATNKHLMIRRMHGGTTGETVGTAINGNLHHYEAYCPVPAGAHLYIRGRCLNAPDTGYNGVAVGIGG